LEIILPRLNVRPLRSISGKTIVMDALTKLRENEYDLLLIEPHLRSGEERPLVISGYSIISKMIQQNQNEFGSFLNSPCIDSSLLVGTISSEEDVISLLHVFQSTSFGFALVHRKQSQYEKISVKDLLKLYQLGIFSSSLTVDEISTSPIFQLSRGTKLGESLREIGRRKFRRIQISGTRMILSDKQILEYLFRSERLDHISKLENRLLDGTLEDIEIGEAPWIDGKKQLSEVAELLHQKNNDCALTDHGLVTPWDLTVKTWEWGQLNVLDPSKA
jgi:hypothetical protein